MSTTPKAEIEALAKRYEDDADFDEGRAKHVRQRRGDSSGFETSARELRLIAGALRLLAATDGAEPVERGIADLIARYYRRQIGHLMQQAEHWAENGKPLAVHCRLHQAQAYYQIVSIMERFASWGENPFAKMRGELSREPYKPPGQWPWGHDMQRYYDAVSVAALTTPTAPEVKAEARPVGVKPLEWRDRHAKPTRPNDLVADGVTGQYAIRPAAGRFRAWFPDIDYNDRMLFETVEAAKAAAQADYEARIRSALVEAPPAPSQEVSAARHVRHKKTGGEYEVIGGGRMQSGCWAECTNPLGYTSIDMHEVTIYQAVKDGSLWVRPVEEFEDGRFEPLTSQEPTS